jgi:cephalosporin-C deacetylase
MPDFEMPLQELRRYTGTNPRPADFDEYWENALAELSGKAPDAVFEPADFRAPYCECFDLWFDGADGSRIHAQYLRPLEVQSRGRGSRAASHGSGDTASGSREELAPALLLFHGYSGDAGPWVEKLAYAAAGFHVFALDCRGQAGLSEDGGGHKGNTLYGHLIRGLYGGAEKLYYRQVFLDTVRLAYIAMALPEIDAGRVSVMGGSQGGALALACASFVPEVEKAVVRYPFLSDYRRVWEMDLDEESYRELRDYFRMYDPLHEREEEIFTRLGYIDVHHLAPRIRAKVLFGCGGMDTVCPPSTQFAAFNAIRSEKKLRYYPDFTHEELEGFDDEAFDFLVYA